MLGCAASVGGAVGPVFAIKECSPDMLSLAGSVRALRVEVGRRGRGACSTCAERNTSRPVTLARLHGKAFGDHGVLILSI
jgi:hypothetical protein